MAHKIGSIDAISETVTFTPQKGKPTTAKISGTFVGTLIVQIEDAEHSSVFVPTGDSYTAPKVIVINELNGSDVQIKSSAWTSGQADIQLLSGAEQGSI